MLRIAGKARRFTKGNCDTGVMAPTNIPQEVDLRIDAGWIIPVEPPGVLVGHALIVDNGGIIALLPTEAADAAYAPRTSRRLPSHALIPGLVNAHTHAAMKLMRGVGDDMPVQEWLQAPACPPDAALLCPRVR